MIAAFGLATATSSSFDRPIPSYQAGEFTDRTLRAPYDFSATDDAATERQRAEAARRTPIVVDVTPIPARALQTSLAETFAPLTSLSAAVGPAPDPVTAPARTRRAFEARVRQRQRALDDAIDTALPGVEQVVAAPAPPALRGVLALDNAGAYLGTALESIVKDAYERPIVVDPGAVWSAVNADPAPAAYDVLLVTGPLERQARQPGALIGLTDARARVRDAPPSLTGVPPTVEAWLRRAVVTALRPNAAVNAETTRQRRAAAAEAVIPVSLSFRRNQLIIGEGQRVTPQTMLVVEHVRMQRRERYSLGRLTVRAALLFVALALAFVSVEGYRPRFIDADGMFVYGLTSLSVAAIAFIAWDALSEQALVLVPGAAALPIVIAFPSAALAMYTRLVAPQATVARLLVAQALVFGLVWQGDARLALFVLASGWIGSHLVADCFRRQGVLKAGLVTGLFSAPIAAFANALDSPSQGVLGANAVAGLTSGVLSSLVVLALGPAYELIFGHLTRIRLIELVNYQHPLLRRLTEETPGTFQHSIGVGVLADAAARATGGDALLVRVAALYHDVGKTKQPQMFVENQQGWNPHEQLPPLESARMIIEHVPEGVRLIREYKLGERLVDFVLEHHGTSPVHFFLAKAARTGAAVDPREFTYPGPAPRSLETLILMVADQVEATARSMPRGDRDSLASMVDDTIDRVRTDGQLADCPVTFRDLAAIREALVTTLAGMAHRRIRYPGQPPSPTPDAAEQDRIA